MTMAVLLVLVLWSVIVLPFIYLGLSYTYNLLKHLKRCVILMKLPGVPPRNLLLGHITEFPGPNEDGLKFMLNRLKEHPRLSYIFIGPNPSVNIVHPDTAKAVLKTSEPKPRDYGAVYHFAWPWLGDGLLIAQGKRWARNRRLLTPAFHFDILKPYVTVNNRATDILLDKWSEFAATGEYFELFNHISLCTFDIILRCAFSYDNNCQLQGESDPYVKAVNELTSVLPYRLLRPWLYPDLFFALSPKGRQFKKNCDFVHELATDIIQKRRRTIESEGVPKTSRYLDFLDILLTAKDSDGTGLTNLEIRNETDTFLFEGHDTTASGITWTLYSLAEHPEIQKRCQQEIDEVLQGRESEDIEWEDLAKLKYLSQCIKEALRLHTPVPFIQRITTKDMYVEGFFIPKGTNISLQLYVMLHNPTVWDKPMEFLPERFDAEGIDKMDSHQFVPFSAGPRNCIGQHFAMHEMKVVIARVLRRYQLELKPGHPVDHVISAVMRAQDGIYLKATERFGNKAYAG